MLRLSFLSLTFALLFLTISSAESANFFKGKLQVTDNLYQDEVFGGKNQPSLFISFVTGNDLLDSGDYAVIVDIDGHGDFDDETTTSYVEIGDATPDTPYLVIWDITKKLKDMSDGKYEIAVIIDNYKDKKIDWGQEIELGSITGSVDNLIMDLDNNQSMTDALQSAFDKIKNLSFSGNVTIEVVEQSKEWLLYDVGKNKSYVIRKSGSGKLVASQKIERDEKSERFVLDRSLTVSDIDVEPPIFSPNGDGIKDSVVIYYTLSENLSNRYAEVAITVGEGKLIVPAKLVPCTQSGRNSVVWDGKDGLGRYVGDGDYIVKVRAKDLGGNETEKTTTAKVRAKVPEITSTTPAGDSIVSTLTEVSAQLKDNSGEGLDLERSTIRLRDPSGSEIPGGQYNDGKSTIKWIISSQLPGDGSRDGRYNIVVTVVDRVGNAKTASYVLLYDSAFPQIVSLTPADSAILTAPPSNITIVMKDGTGSGPDMAATSKTLKINGGSTAGSIIHNGVDTITFTPFSELGKGTHTIEIIPSDLAGNKPSQPLKFQFTVAPISAGGQPPSLSLSPTSLDLGAMETRASFTIANNSSEKLTWNIWNVTDELPGWLEVSPMKGETLPGATASITIEVNRQELNPGIYTYTVSIASNGGSGSVSVTMIVPEPEPAFSLYPSSIDLDATKTEDSFSIANDGNGILRWSIVSDLPIWLKAEPMSGEASPGGSSLVTLSVSTQGLSPGIYKHNVSVTSADKNSSISVTMKIEETKLTVVSVETKQTVPKGEAFTVKVNIENISDLAGFQMDVTFDPSILFAIRVEEGSFVSSNGKTYWLEPNISNSTGRITSIVCAKTDKGGINGNGVLANITFRAMGTGESYIKLQNVKLSDPSGRAIPFSTKDGKISVQELLSKEYPPWDSNKDGKIDIIDLIIVGQYFGEKITTPLSPNPDINGDGIVDILDFILVGQHFGEVYSPSAPSACKDSLDARHLPLLIRIYNIVEDNPCSDPGFATTRNVLSRIIQRFSVSKTEVFQNYPNPFNPETWIPYQLTEGSEVIIRIYSATGQLIRVLNMGHKEAGIYVTKDKAVYWDGTTDAGEHVPSGVYFYNIQAGDYSATKKMVLAQ